MKYLAILRDSFRESLDSKVIYFTLGLSILLFVLLSSVHFRPVSVEEEAELMVERMNGFMPYRVQVADNSTSTEFEPPKVNPKEVPKLELKKFEQLDKTKPRWQSGYRYVVRLHIPKNLEDQAKSIQSIVESELSRKQWWLEPTVQKEVRKEGREVDFIVTSKVSKITKAEDWPHEPSIFFGAVPLIGVRASLGQSIYVIVNNLVNNIGGWVIILIGVIITAFFIPNMLQKGSVDLLLAKPITRVGLLLLKFVGGLTFVFVNSVIAIIGVWLIIGLRTGLWTYSFPLTVLIITFFFAILYSVSTLFGVLTRSSVLSIFMTCLVWFLLFVLGQVHSILNSPFMDAQIQMGKAKTGTSKIESAERSNAETTELVRNIVNGVHAVLPRTNDLAHLNTELIREELFSEEELKRLPGREQVADYNWLESGGVSLAFIVVMLSLACWRFAVRDY